jgi:uncharacterized repeat protein (TIGR03803 family)
MKRNQFWATMSKALAVLTVTLIAASILAPGARAADEFKILYKFDSSSGPEATLIFDASGNLYGATVYGGQYGEGGVYKLTPNSNGRWTESELYSFTGGSDGALPNSAVIFDASGNLYSVTYEGGEYGYGVVYELTPNSDGTWTESVLHSFTGGSDGSHPGMGEIFDAAGNLYGTTRDGGAYGDGVVFELTPNSNGTWTETVLHSFSGGKDGATPDFGNLIFDAAGNLYGTTGGWDGGDTNGTVFELTPNSGGTWTESVLHSFRGGKDGSRAVGALTFDQAGNLYGATYSGGTYGEGTIFKLTPGSNGKWTKDVIHQFRGKTGGDGSNPYAGVIFDTAGNLFGTTYDGGIGTCSYQGPGCGTVFELVPNSKGGWTEQILHRFGTVGSSPVGAVLMDAAGNLYAATSNETLNGLGTVFEITP